MDIAGQSWNAVAVELLYYGIGALLVVGLLVLLVRTSRWIGQSTADGLEQTRRFAEALGLELLDAEGRSLGGVVERLPVTLGEGSLLCRAYQGRVGRIRTLRITVQAAAGRWLLCARHLADELDPPLPEVGQEHALGEPDAAQRFLLRATEEPTFATDGALLQALAETELKLGRAAEDRTTVDFLPPVEHVGGLGGSVESLRRLLMLSLALAAPERASTLLGEQ